jgi:hypothetical protein
LFVPPKPTRITLPSSITTRPERFDRIVDPDEFVAVQHARCFELRARRELGARFVAIRPAIQRVLVRPVTRARAAQERLVISGHETVERSVRIGQLEGCEIGFEEIASG